MLKGKKKGELPERDGLGNFPGQITVAIQIGIRSRPPEKETGRLDISIRAAKTGQGAREDGHSFGGTRKGGDRSGFAKFDFLFRGKP